jgi:DNA invertase Pin-like site-specific DNA recombinase
LQSIMDGIDTKTAVGRMVFSMIGAISEFELNVISERTRAGMAAARRRGRHAAVCRNSRRTSLITPAA